MCATGLKQREAEIRLAEVRPAYEEVQFDLHLEEWVQFGKVKKGNPRPISSQYTETRRVLGTLSVKNMWLGPSYAIFLLVF